jgi:acetyltransferase-like isoleucine patch superfamily enzyme
MDYSGQIFRGLRWLRNRVTQTTGTVISYFLAFLKGVETGKGCRFWGITYFRRYVDSTITIGSNCSFRSDRRSNLAGINRSCIVATHGRGARIVLGDHCGLSGTVIGAATSVSIGSHVMIGANSFITDFDWHSLYPETRNTHFEKAPVIIGNHVWIAANCVILKGVTIGDNAVIGVNSVVLSDIPANVLAAGNPCKIIKQIPVNGAKP